MRVFLLVIAIAVLVIALFAAIPFMLPVEWLRQNGFDELAITVEWSKREISDAWDFSDD